MKKSEESRIDFVIPWVDGSDLEWRKLKGKYEGSEKTAIDSSDVRYRDYGLLKYIFRGIEEFTPWVNKVFFITNGQIPSWLNLQANKLEWIRHEDYIPEEYLPTFSANPIELSLHRIDSLSDRFVYFNDDFFLIKPLPESHFFQDGLPVLSPKASFTVPHNGYDQFAHLMLNNVMLINKHFDARKVILSNKRNWLSPCRVGLKSAIQNCVPLSLGYFTGFSNPHLPSPFLKEVYREVWNEESGFLCETMKHRFRSNDDFTQYLFYDWQLANKQFVATKRNKLGRYFEIQKDIESNKELINSIVRQTHPVVCINDTKNDMSDMQFEELMGLLDNAFSTILPRKSSFEKE